MNRFRSPLIGGRFSRRRGGLCLSLAVLALLAGPGPGEAQGPFLSEPGWIDAPPESLRVRGVLPPPMVELVAYVHDLTAGSDDWAGFRLVRTSRTSPRARLLIGGTFETRRDRWGGCWSWA